MEAPIDRHSEMEAVGTIIPGEWNNIRLRGTGLARLAGGIRSSGLMDLNHAYLTLIPPLHAYARLGELDCVVETLFRQTLQYEKILNWTAAYESYNAMLDLASQFREDSFTFRRTVAIVVEYMRTIRGLPRIPESGGNQFLERESIHDKLLRRLSHSAYQQIQNDLKILYERHQRGSLTSTYNDRQQFEVNCSFTQLHELVAHPDSEIAREIYEIQMMYPRSGGPTESQVAFGEIPEQLQKHVRLHDILGWTPLHYVVALKVYEAREWTESLLSKGADIDATDIRGWTPLHHSIWNRNTEAFVELFKKGANVKVAGVDGTTPLHIAAAKMGAFEVNKLITNPRQRADQFATDNLGRIPIHLAAQEGNKDVIDSFRLSINGKDHQGRTALHLAVFSGHLETLSKIIECGASLDETFQYLGRVNKYTALHWAVGKSKTKTAIKLLESGANVDARYSGLATPIHHACVTNNPEMIDILIEHGADVNARAEYYHTPLCSAASSGYTLCVERLLKVPNIDLSGRQASNDDDPLLRAIKHGYGDIVRMLVEKGAIISQRMVEVAMALNESAEHQSEVEDEEHDEEGVERGVREGQVRDQTEDEKGEEDDEGVQEEEDSDEPGLKAQAIGKYIRAALSLRNAFEEHVHGEWGVSYFQS
ncbi:ankyrin repeat [Fusarium napiforme]|uniref:Ankyrin repeat n=1 Tax=Fusarium napiforme TaxID=42672 RepID=A0A8H5IRR9_9HYPO|nr:ankyrin repeat [Fusarium napiforme]